MKIGYARVSTSDQKIESQVEILEKEGCEIIYKEKISSMATRPQLELLLKHLQPHDHVVITKLDRIGRSLKHLIDLKDLFESKNVQFTSLKDSIDTTTPSGRLMFNMLGSVAEFERELIRDRITTGIERAKRLGRVGGRPSGVASKTLKKALITYAISKANPELSITKVADLASVTRATYYRHMKIANEHYEKKGAE